jgi:hypothetical protein
MHLIASLGKWQINLVKNLFTQSAALANSFIASRDRHSRSSDTAFHFFFQPPTFTLRVGMRQPN